MQFLPLPHGTSTFVISALSLLLVWLVWGTFKYPEALWAPGDLSRFHADITKCRSCHQPFRGVAAGKCVSCHDEKQFAVRSKPAIFEFHRKTINEGTSCAGCHTEHRGALSQITGGAMANPHGEFIFRVTQTYSCTACHDFSAGVGSDAFLLDNRIVSRLMDEGKGAHRRGKMANCLMCHISGRLKIDDTYGDH